MTSSSNRKPAELVAHESEVLDRSSDPEEGNPTTLEGWRSLAYELAEELTASTARNEILFDEVALLTKRLHELEAETKRDRLIAKLVRVIDRHIEEGTVRLDMVVKKAPGRKRRLTEDQQAKLDAALVEIARRRGASGAARIFAEWGRQNGERRSIKTWLNRISQAKENVTASIFKQHGAGLAALDELQKRGLVKRKKLASRKQPK